MTAIAAPLQPHAPAKILTRHSSQFPQSAEIWILHDDNPRLLKTESYECEQLAAAARRMGVNCRIVSSDRLHVVITADRGARLLLDGCETPLPSLVIPRNGAHTTYKELTVLRYFERHGVPCINSSSSIQAAADKFHAHAILAGHIPVPKTLLLDESTDLDLVEHELGFPVVVKLLAGTQGAGVMPLLGKSALRDLRDMMSSAGRPANMLVQKLIADSTGRDLRVLVVGGRAVACMLRTASRGEVKANFSQGGSVERHPVTPEIAEMAIQTCDLLGLQIAGVDLLFDGDGYRVCEANSSPGWQGLERCHQDLDIAATLIRYALPSHGLGSSTLPRASGDNSLTTETRFLS